jgi:hypothetical protein
MLMQGGRQEQLPDMEASQTTDQPQYDTFGNKMTNQSLWLCLKGTVSKQEQTQPLFTRQRIPDCSPHD